jgi:hypothetical protein
MLNLEAETLRKRLATGAFGEKFLSPSILLATASAIVMPQ